MTLMTIIKQLYNNRKNAFSLEGHQTELKILNTIIQFK